MESASVEVSKGAAGLDSQSVSHPRRHNAHQSESRTYVSSVQHTQHGGTRPYFVDLSFI
jgi:hypothetical protein